MDNTEGGHEHISLCHQLICLVEMKKTMRRGGLGGSGDLEASHPSTRFQNVNEEMKVIPAGVAALAVQHQYLSYLTVTGDRLPKT